MTQAIISPIAATNASEDKLLWTSADLELLPDNGNRYEIINSPYADRKSKDLS